MTQEKARELLTGLSTTADGRKTCAYEIADRPRELDPELQTAPSSPARCSLARLIASRRSVLIRPPACAGSATEPRRRNHARRGSTDAESHSRKVRPRSRTEVKRSRHVTASSPELSQPPLCSRPCHTRAHHLPHARLGQRYRDRLLVHVKTGDGGHSFVQDPSPMHGVRLPEHPGQPSISLHTWETGRPFRQANIWSSPRDCAVHDLRRPQCDGKRRVPPPHAQPPFLVPRRLVASYPCPDKGDQAKADDPCRDDDPSDRHAVEYDGLPPEILHSRTV